MCIGGMELRRSAFSSGVNVRAVGGGFSKSTFNVPSAENLRASWWRARSKSRIIIGREISEGICEWAVDVENRLELRLDFREGREGDGARVESPGVGRISRSSTGDANSVGEKVKEGS